MKTLEEADGAGPIKIGAIFDLTGPTSDVGTIYSEGMRAYVDWLNAKGGLENRPDRPGLPGLRLQGRLAEQLYSQFVQEGVVAFMGWGTGDTEALRSRVADGQDAVHLGLVLAHPERPQASRPTTSCSAPATATRCAIVLDWIKENHPAGGAEPVVALMHHPSPFGLSPYEQGGHDYAASKGIRLDKHEMPRGSTDYTAELTKSASRARSTSCSRTRRARPPSR